MNDIGKRAIIKKRKILALCGASKFEYFDFILRVSAFDATAPEV